MRALIGLLFVAACGSSDDPMDGGDPDGGESDANGDDDDDDSGEPTATPLGKSGFVYVVASAVDAQFFDATEVGSTCTARTVDGCVITECNRVGVGGFVPIVESFLSAGTLSVSGESGTVSGENDSSGYQLRNEESAWAAGEEISIEATGDAVPAFDATLVMPARMTATRPTLPSGSFDFMIDVDEGLDVEWTGGSDDIELRMVQVRSSEREAIYVRCVAPAEDGTVTASTEVLEALDRFSTVLVTAAPTTSERVDAGGFDVLVMAQAPGFTARGALSR